MQDKQKGKHALVSSPVRIIFYCFFSLLFTFSIHPIRTTFADILARDRIAFSGDYSPLDLSLVLIPLSLAVLFSFLERPRDMFVYLSHCDAALHCNPVVHSFILEDIVKSYFLLV